MQLLTQGEQAEIVINRHFDYQTQAIDVQLEEAHYHRQEYLVEHVSSPWLFCRLETIQEILYNYPHSEKGGYLPSVVEYTNWYWENKMNLLNGEEEEFCAERKKQLSKENIEAYFEELLEEVDRKREGVLRAKECFLEDAKLDPHMYSSEYEFDAVVYSSAFSFTDFDCLPSVTEYRNEYQRQQQEGWEL